MWLITEAPVTVRTAHGDVKLLLGVPHELSDAIGERVLQRAGDRVRVHGSALEERLQLAASMIHALEGKTPGLKQLLKSKGIGDNAIVANMLIAQAQKYHARNKA